MLILLLHLVLITDRGREMAGRRIHQNLLDNESYHAWKQDIILNHRVFFPKSATFHGRSRRFPVYFIQISFSWQIHCSKVMPQSQKISISFCPIIPGCLSKRRCFFPPRFSFVCFNPPLYMTHCVLSMSGPAVTTNYLEILQAS